MFLVYVSLFVTVRQLDTINRLIYIYIYSYIYNLCFFKSQSIFRVAIYHVHFRKQRDLMRSFMLTPWTLDTRKQVFFLFPSFLSLFLFLSFFFSHAFFVVLEPVLELALVDQADLELRDAPASVF